MSSKPEWTDGEWISREVEDVESKLKTYCISTISDSGTRTIIADWIYNKSESDLLAASKDLYAACEAALSVSGSLSTNVAVKQQLQSALSKARGEIGPQSPEGET